MDQKNITASVKWFKADKGYGFVRFSDGIGEAFLHSSVLAPTGLSTLADGATIVCDVVAGAKGPQVSAIHRIESAPPDKPPPQAKGRGSRAAGASPDSRAAGGRPAPDPRPREPEPIVGELTLGSVRWYNLDGQCGFIDPAEGGESIYFDRATLRRSSLEILADGEDVWFLARDTADGPVAEHVELARHGAE